MQPNDIDQRCQRTRTVGVVERQEEGASKGQGQHRAKQRDDGEAGEEGVRKGAGAETSDDVDDDEDDADRHYDHDQQLQPHRLLGYY